MLISERPLFFFLQLFEIHEEWRRISSLRIGWDIDFKESKRIYLLLEKLFVSSRNWTTKLTRRLTTVLEIFGKEDREIEFPNRDCNRVSSRRSNQSRRVREVNLRLVPFHKTAEGLASREVTCVNLKIPSFEQPFRSSRFPPRFDPPS